MNIFKRAERALLKRILPLPVSARHVEYSAISSADDERGRPTERLIDLSLAAIAAGRGISLSHVSDRVKGPIRTADIWPGENYKLLAGIVRVLAPKLIVEIGTGGATGTLSMFATLPSGSRIVTFDVVPWFDYPETLIRKSDLTDGRMIQHTDDLTRPELFEKHRALFEQADLIFIDAAKDGVMEQVFIDKLRTVVFRNPPVVVFDDIRVWNMLKIWRDLELPKLDLTSFGHWTGTGIVDWPRR